MIIQLAIPLKNGFLLPTPQTREKDAVEGPEAAACEAPRLR
jgi:hypothetical protein